jgi:hypothetical protein
VGRDTSARGFDFGKFRHGTRGRNDRAGVCERGDYSLIYRVRRARTCP